MYLITDYTRKSSVDSAGGSSLFDRSNSASSSGGSSSLGSSASSVCSDSDVQSIYSDDDCQEVVRQIDRARLLESFLLMGFEPLSRKASEAPPAAEKDVENFFLIYRIEE